VPRAPVALALAAALAARPALAAPPLTLDEALAVASRESPDLALARADADAADADRTASVAGVLPRLDLSSSFGHDYVGASDAERDVLQAGGLIPLERTRYTHQEAYALSLRLVQPLFDWATFREVRRARFGARAAARQYDEAALSVSFEVTRRFYEVVRGERTLAVLEKAAVRSEELVARADALYAAGRAPKSDTLQARVNLANDRVAVQAQVVRAARARHALAQALGRDDGAELAVVPPLAVDGAAPAAPGPPPLEALLAIGQDRRPALAAQAALVGAADAAIGTARAGYLPTLQAQASYGRQGATLAGDDGGVYLDDPSRNFSATTELVLSWNLFEGRRTVANVRRAEASARRARAAHDRTAAQVTQEIADARAAVAALSLEVALAAEGLALAEQGLALARERLDAGLASQLEVRDASLKLTQAELSLLEARIDDAVARADLARAVGGPF
jgi:outer membrane protein TolC